MNITFRRLLVSLVGAFVLSAGVGALASGAWAASPTPSICSTSFDPYSVSAATLQACDGKSYPRESVSALPDGGSAYHFQVGHFNVRYLVPPASFQPAHATAAELAIYGLIAPAENSPERNSWDEMVSNVQFGGPPSRQIILSRQSAGGGDLAMPGSEPSATAGSETSLNWSGYVNYASSQKYHTASAYFIEPTTVPTCLGSSEVAWSGLGGVNNKEALEQDGTANETGGLGNHQAWWEVIPEGIAPVEGVYATPGAYFEAQTHYVSTSQVDFYFYNESTHKGYSVEVSGAINSDLSTAEYIVERPEREYSETEGEIVPLANYKTVTMQGFSEGTALANYPYNISTMYDTKPTVLATASGIPPSTYLFTDQYHTCGLPYRFKYKK